MEKWNFAVLSHPTKVAPLSGKALSETAIMPRAKILPHTKWFDNVTKVPLIKFRLLYFTTRSCVICPFPPPSVTEMLVYFRPRVSSNVH